MKRITIPCIALGLISLMACHAPKSTSNEVEEAPLPAPVDTLAYYSRADSLLMDSVDRMEGIQRSLSGLRYLVLQSGEGERPAEEDTIVVGYRGLHADGSSFWEAESEEFPLKGTIKGFCEGVGRMAVGEKCMLYIPSAIAYGGKGYPELIAPNEPLIYEVELKGVKKAVK